MKVCNHFWCCQDGWWIAFAWFKHHHKPPFLPTDSGKVWGIRNRGILRILLCRPLALLLELCNTKALINLRLGQRLIRIFFRLIACFFLFVSKERSPCPFFLHLLHFG